MNIRQCYFPSLRTKQVALLSQTGRAMLRVCLPSFNSMVQYLERICSLLVILASDLHCVRLNYVLLSRRNVDSCCQFTYTWSFIVRLPRSTKAAAKCYNLALCTVEMLTTCTTPDCPAAIDAKDR